MQSGAAYVPRKPGDFDGLVTAVQAAAESTRARREAARGGAR